MSMSFSNVNFFLVSVIWRLLFERHVVKLEFQGLVKH